MKSNDDDDGDDDDDVYIEVTLKTEQNNFYSYSAGIYTLTVPSMCRATFSFSTSNTKTFSRLSLVCAICFELRNEEEKRAPSPTHRFVWEREWERDRRQTRSKVCKLEWERKIIFWKAFCHRENSTHVFLCILEHVLIYMKAYAKLHFYYAWVFPSEYISFPYHNDVTSTTTQKIIRQKINNTYMVGVGMIKALKIPTCEALYLHYFMGILQFSQTWHCTPSLCRKCGMYFFPIDARQRHDALSALNARVSRRFIELGRCWIHP